MTDNATLRDLYDRVSEATGLDKRLLVDAALTLCDMRRITLFSDEDVVRVEWPEFGAFLDAKAWIDAVEALRERMLPEWFIDSVGEVRKAIRYAGDKHDLTGEWMCAIQHINGGRLQKGYAPSEPLARLLAVIAALMADPKTEGKSS